MAIHPVDDPEMQSLARRLADWRPHAEALRAHADLPSQPRMNLSTYDQADEAYRRARIGGYPTGDRWTDNHLSVMKRRMCEMFTPDETLEHAFSLIKGWRNVEAFTLAVVPPISLWMTAASQAGVGLEHGGGWAGPVVALVPYALWSVWVMHESPKQLLRSVLVDPDDQAEVERRFTNDLKMRMGWVLAVTALLMFSGSATLLVEQDGPVRHWWLFGAAVAIGVGAGVRTWADRRWGYSPWSEAMFTRILGTARPRAANERWWNRWFI